jgi:hypothetical protein
MVSQVLGRSRRHEHHTSEIVGWICLALTIIGLATFLPDFIRYLRIRRM